MSRTRIARSTTAIALATAASRILGFARDILIARLFGTGLQSQAFVVAFRLPNLLRDLVAEGAATSAIVPVLSAARSTQQSEQYWRLAQALAVQMTAAALVLSVTGVWLAPWLVHAIAPGFASEPEKFALTVTLTRWLFPFITLVGLWAFFCGLLNSLGQFALPALGPAVLNVAMIAGCVWLVPASQPPILGLVWGVIIGGVLQLAIQVPAARRAGFRWRWVWRHPASHEVMQLLGPRVLGAAVHQLTVFMNTILASMSVLAGEGAVAALYFANRLVQLPLALFGVASAQASLPSLAEQAARGETAQFRATITAVLRMMAFVTIPSAVGLCVLAEPIVRVCLEAGAFDHRSTMMTARTLAAFSLGLIGFSVSKVLSGAFYALRDTRTPVRLAFEAFIVNALGALALIRPLQVGGLALAASVASILNAWRLLGCLERRLQVRLGPELAGPFLRMAAAASLMAAACWGGWRWLERLMPAVAALPIVVVGGILIYGLACAALRVRELATALQWIRRRPEPSSGNA